MNPEGPTRASEQTDEQAATAAGLRMFSTESMSTPS